MPASPTTVHTNARAGFSSAADIVASSASRPTSNGASGAAARAAAGASDVRISRYAAFVSAPGSLASSRASAVTQAWYWRSAAARWPCAA